MRMMFYHWPRLTSLEADVEKYSGEIYHINNIEPIIRNDDQRILVTFALKY